MSYIDDPVRLDQAIRDMLREQFGITDPLDLLPLHPEQNNIGWGSTFAVFGGLDLAEPEHRFIIYGQIPSRLAITQHMQWLHMSAEEMATVIVKEQAILDSGYVIGSFHSRHRPDGHPDKQHKSLCWPIPRPAFDGARDAGWAFEAMDEGTQAHLGIACAAWRTYKQTTGADL